MALQRWRAPMEYYVGLDVSLKQTSICVMDQSGSVVRKGVVDPEAISVYVRSKAPGTRCRWSVRPIFCECRKADPIATLNAAFALRIMRRFTPTAERTVGRQEYRWKA